MNLWRPYRRIWIRVYFWLRGRLVYWADRRTQTACIKWMGKYGVSSGRYAFGRLSRTYVLGRTSLCCFPGDCWNVGWFMYLLHLKLFFVGLKRMSWVYCIWFLAERKKVYLKSNALYRIEDRENSNRSGWSDKNKYMQMQFFLVPVN